MPPMNDRTKSPKTDPRLHPVAAARVRDPLHLDHLAGGFTKIAFRFALPVANTLADVGVYQGLSSAELFPNPQSLPEVSRTSRWRVPGLVCEDLVFRSPHEPLEPSFRRRFTEQYTATQLVYARRIRPATARPRLRLLYLHGYMQPETIIEEVTLLPSLALALDVEIIQMQPPYHGRRAPGQSRFSGEFFWTADLVRSVEALRQTMLDARTLLSWLYAEDARPVGVAGLSLGGALTLSLACLDERFAFALPLIAHMDLAALVSDAPVLSKMRHDLKSFGWGRDEFARFVAAIGWDALLPKLPPEKVLLIAAAHDRFFEPAVVESMRQRWGTPAIHWYPSSHMGFMPYLPNAIRDMRQFLDQQR